MNNIETFPNELRDSINNRINDLYFSTNIEDLYQIIQQDKEKAYQIVNQNPQSIKDGVDFVFEQSEELSKIGTKEQYSQYLDQIFPISKVKDIVYHGVLKGKEAYNNIIEKGFDFKNFKNWINPKTDVLKEGSNSGMFFSDEGTAQSYGFNEDRYTDNTAKDFIIPAILNIEFLVEQETNSGRARQFYAQNKEKKNIGMYGIEAGDEIHWNHVVFEPEQIHILGSKKDLEGFKEFAENNSNLIDDIVKYVQREDEINLNLPERDTLC